jgi:hypothetical protein
MKRFLRQFTSVLLLILIFLTVPSWGASVTPEQVAQVVQGWFTLESNPLGEKARTISKVSMYNDSTIVSSLTEALYYAVFLTPKGIVFVPADDRVSEPVIAYQPDAVDYDPAKEGPFQTLINSGLGSWVKAVRANQSSSSVARAEESKWSRLLEAQFSYSIKALPSVPDVRVAPLLTSKWSQGNLNDYTGTGTPAYNYYTPGNSVTGCVATATGQIMYYFQHPIAGIGAKDYDYTYIREKKTGTTRGGDGHGGPYQWSSMADMLTESSSKAQIESVATLLYDIGVSSHAKYSVFINGTSASYGSAFLRLKDLFEYENAQIAYAEKNHSSLSPEGMRLIFNSNLDAKLPVSISISNSRSAHAAVVDGYGYDLSKTLFHHLNMGLSGQDNAWFALPMIDSTYTGPYNIIDGCIYNIYKSGTGEIISGRVLDESGTPVADVSVFLRELNRTATTDAKGIFSFTAVPSNRTYTLKAKKNDYLFTNKTITVTESKSPQINEENSTTIGESVCGNVWNAEITGKKGAVFVPVTNIDADIPTETYIHTALIFTAEVTPTNATNQSIEWSVKNAGTTGATITGNTFNATAAGEVTITATIPDGKAEDSDYTQDFIIKVLGDDGGDDDNENNEDNENNGGGGSGGNNSGGGGCSVFGIGLGILALAGVALLGTKKHK